MEKVEHSLATAVFSPNIPQFQDGLHLDLFLSDWDIEKILERYLGCNSWKDARIGVRNACYRGKYKKDSLPKWEPIEKQI